jgi:hypothetical protein
MLKFLENLPENTIAIEVSGDVTKDQYEALVVPKMDELAKRQGEINYVVVLKSGLGSFTAGVWWDDFKMALAHLGKWRKVAIVTDEKIVENVTKIFGFAFPGDHRVFKLSKQDQAIAWASK